MFFLRTFQLKVVDFSFYFKKPLRRRSKNKPYNSKSNMKIKSLKHLLCNIHLSIKRDLLSMKTNS